MKMEPTRGLMASCMLFGAALGGCVDGGSGTIEDGNVGGGLDGETARVSGEPNDSFEDALIAIFDDEGMAHLQGSIAFDGDVDVYDLGPMDAGDRIVVDVSHLGSRLDSAVALFDADGVLFIENDDRDLASGQLEPFVNEVVRHTSETYFLAVTNAPVTRATGTYSASVRVIRGGEVPPTESQLVLLDFDGGFIDIPGDGSYTVDAFDTGDINERYESMTPIVKRTIVSTVDENFEGLALELITTDDSLPPGDDEFSRILFGAFNPRAFGISQQIDPFNTDVTDEAIIFTEVFQPDMFVNPPSAVELGRAIGNVASHEIGHLLGLNHTVDVTSLMDTTGDAETLLLDQDFKLAPLHESIFPIGAQDAWLLLLETIGLDPSLL